MSTNFTTWATLLERYHIALYLVNQVFSWPMHHNTHPDTASLVCVWRDHQTQILLVKRSDIPIWVLPGGGVDPGESPDQAAAREVLEETGLVIASPKHIAILTPRNMFTKKTYLYSSTPASGQLEISDESPSVGFFSVKHLPKNLFELHNIWIHLALTNPKTPLTQTITQVTWPKILATLCKKPHWIVKFLWTRWKTKHTQRP